MSDSPAWYTAEGELEAQVDLEDLGWGTFHILDASWASVTEATNCKGTAATAMTLKAYMGSETDGPKDWPSKDGTRKEWTTFVGELPTKVVTRLSEAINRFAGIGDDDREDSAGN